MDTHTHTHAYRWMIEGLHILNERKVVFARVTPGLFLYACDAVGMLENGVDVLLDKEQTLGKWSTRMPINIALEK